MYQKRRNYLDDSCEFIQVPPPGPVRMTHFIWMLLQSPLMRSGPQTWPRAPSMPSAREAAWFGPGRPQGVWPGRPDQGWPSKPDLGWPSRPEGGWPSKPDLGFGNEDSRSCIKEPELGQDLAGAEEDLEEETLEPGRPEPPAPEQGRFLGRVKYFNENDSGCAHNIFLRYDQHQEHPMKVTQLENNSFLVKFVAPAARAEDARGGIGEAKEATPVQKAIFSFFQTVRNFKRTSCLVAKLRARLVGGAGLHLRYGKIKAVMTSFFSMRPFEEGLAKLNRLEALFLGVVLHKKKFQDWDHRRVDFGLLQRSRSKQQRMRLLETFVVHLLHHMAEQHCPSRSVSKQKKIESLFTELFGARRAPSLQNIKTVRDQIRAIRHRSAGEGAARGAGKFSREQRLRQFVREMTRHAGLRAAASREALARMAQRIFEEYRDRKVARIMARIVNALEARVEPSQDRAQALLQYCVDLRANSKFKCAWTKAEFLQGKEIFVDFGGL